MDQRVVLDVGDLFLFHEPEADAFFVDANDFSRDFDGLSAVAERDIQRDDLAHMEYPRIRPDETLEAALAKFGPQGLEAMPVVDATHDNRLVGILRRDAVISYYNRKLLERIQD